MVERTVQVTVTRSQAMVQALDIKVRNLLFHFVPIRQCDDPPYPDAFVYDLGYIDVAASRRRYLRRRLSKMRPAISRLSEAKSMSYEMTAWDSCTVNR